MLKNKLVWLVVWVAAHAISFTVGDLLGGRAGLPKLIGEALGMLNNAVWFPGSVLYGLCFGTASALLLFRYAANVSRLVRVRWAVCYALGFAVGVTLGEKVAYRLPTVLPIGVWFGLVVGMCIGLAQMLALRGAVRNAWVWLPAGWLVWVIGETLAFALGFELRNTPVVGAAIGATSGLLMLWLFPNARALQDP